MDLSSQHQPLDAPGVAEIDGELASRIASDGRVQVEVIEHLRVQVPAAARQAWLEAEQASWEPWLRSQKGFLGRELRWDREREEGQLLIRWASRAQWHAIPRDEIEAVQERFEALAHQALRRLAVQLPRDQAESANPFPLLLSEELPPEALLESHP
ncbi:MAG: TIGR03792 family protein [Cyanobium sp.]